MRVRLVEPFDDRRGNADVGNYEVTHAGFPWGQHQRELRRRQRDGQRRLNGFSDDFVGVGRQAARQIDGDDGDTGPIEIGDHGLQHASERLRQAGSEDCVDDHIEAEDLREV